MLSRPEPVPAVDGGLSHEDRSLHPLDMRSQFLAEANILVVITSPLDTVRGVAQRPCLIVGEERS